MRCLLLTVVVGLGLIGFASSPSAQAQLSVAVLGAPAVTDWNHDVQIKLKSTGLFTNVDIFDVSTATPTLDQLRAYGSVLVYTDIGFANAEDLGNMLADYVDGGSGVVIGNFANASIPLESRFQSDDYYALEPAGQDSDIDLTLGTIHELGSPLLAAVTSFDGGFNSYYGTGVLNTAAIAVAKWSNGVPLVVRRVINGTNRVNLNFYAPSSDARFDFWDANTTARGSWQTL